METGIKNQPESQKPWKKLFIAGMAIMLIANGVTLFILFSEKHDKEVVIVEKESLTNDYNNVMAELDAKKADLEQLRGQNQDMDKKIDEQEKMIEDEKAQLEDQFKKNSITAAELGNARKRIREYEVSISDLQMKVAEYEVQTKQLTADKEVLTSDLSCEKEVTAQLTTVNDSLGRKVDAGSYLQIPHVDVAAVRRKNNGQEVAVDKAKAADMLKISFETGVNKVIDPGTISFYVRIINPRGETIAVNEQGSGVIPGTDESKPVLYTKKQNVQYNQTNKKVVLYWTRYISDPGLYRIEVYQSGKVIGKGAVRLT